MMDDKPLWGNTLHRQFTPLQAMKHHCLDCMGGHEEAWSDIKGKRIPPFRPTEEVRACPSKSCYLYPFRMGRNPRRKGLGRVENLSRKGRPAPR